MNITQDLQKWGNSTGVRIPKKVLQAARFEPNQTVKISIHGQSIVLTPAKDAVIPSLDDLLKDITPENKHGEYDWGQPVGKEVW